LREIERAGGTALASYDSVDSPESAEAIVRTAVDRFGRLDAVVSNAGIFNSHPFEGLPADEWRRMLSVHLDDGFYLSQHAYRVMKPQGYGRFVFISSSGGMFGQPLETHYAAAKAGRPDRADECDRDRGRRARDPRQYCSALRLLSVTGTVDDPEALNAPGFLNAIKPELAVPIVVFLASRACELATTTTRRAPDASHGCSWALARLARGAGQ
jgi:hypothetical protein